MRFLVNSQRSPSTMELGDAGKEKQEVGGGEVGKVRHLDPVID